MSSWWYEPELAKQVEKAKKDNSITFPYVETEYRYQLKK